MAKMDDVLSAVTTLIKNALASKPQLHVVYPGWPHPEELNKDLQGFRTNISIYPQQGSEKRAPVPMTSNIALPPVIGLVAVASNTQLQGGAVGVSATGTVTFSGVVGNGLNLLLKIDSVYVAYHPTHPAPPAAPLTLADVASQYAAIINADAAASAIVTASAAGNVLTLTAKTAGPAANAIEFWLRVGGTGSVLTLVEKHQLTMQVHVWSYDHPTRMLFADAVQSVLDDNQFLVAPDTSPIRLTFSKVGMADNEIHLGIYRRVLHYEVEYSTTRSAEAYTVLEGLVSVTPES